MAGPHPRTRHSLQAAAGVISLALLAAGCGDGGRDEGRIVFQSDRTGRWAIYSVRPDGSGLARVKLGRPGYAPSILVWSPRGGRLFTPVESEQGSASLVFDAKTGARRRLPVHDAGGEAWSADGERLAIAGDAGIVVVDADGSHRRQLTRDSIHAEPAWSPDGKRIAYSSENKLYTVASTGGRSSLLLRLRQGGLVGSPRWSPDGRWIAFTRNGEIPEPDLLVVDPSGRGRRLLVRGADEVSWSPRDDTLVYVHGPSIYRVDAERGGHRRLTSESEGAVLEPAWSPDGSRIAYLRPQLAPGVREPITKYQLWVMNADGSGKRPLTRPFPSGGSNELPAWINGDVRVAPVSGHARLVSLPRRFVLETREPIGGLGADGTHAVIEQGLGSATEFWNPPAPLLVWEPSRRRLRRLPVRKCGSAYDVIVAGRLLAYTCDNSGTDVLAAAVRVQRLSGGAIFTAADTEATNFRPGTLLRGVAGRGPLLAFAVGAATKPVLGGFRAARTQVAKVVNGRVVPLRAWREDASVVSTDGRRVVVMLGRRRVIVTNTAGRTLKQLSFGRNGVQDAALDGGRLLVMLRRRLAVYDLGSGDRLAAWPISRGSGPQPQLEDAERGLAVYTAGIALHVLRISDGRDVAIRSPLEAGPAFAELVPDGLFYAYNRAYSKPPGRVVFVRRAELVRALR